MPPNGKFELPELQPLDFSLTDGTNIPPPPKSPVEERPPNPVAKDLENRTPAPVSIPRANGTNGTANGGTNGHKNSLQYDREPLSPASSKRPSSIRRFLSRKSMNANYNADAEPLSPRPESAMSYSPSAKRQKSGSWFRKAWGGKRTSAVLEESDMAAANGPAPPKLPELNMLKAKVVDNSEGLGGDDMFKNIK